jgi:hypothetical protein
LVRMHGGDLTLASEIGVGTTVEIRLPADRLRPSMAAAAAWGGDVGRQLDDR